MKAATEKRWLVINDTIIDALVSVIVSRDQHSAVQKCTLTDMRKLRTNIRFDRIDTKTDFLK